MSVLPGEYFRRDAFDIKIQCALKLTPNCSVNLTACSEPAGFCFDDVALAGAC